MRFHASAFPCQFCEYPPVRCMFAYIYWKLRHILAGNVQLSGHRKASLTRKGYAASVRQQAVDGCAAFAQGGLCAALYNFPTKPFGFAEAPNLRADGIRPYDILTSRTGGPGVPPLQLPTKPLPLGFAGDPAFEGGPGVPHLLTPRTPLRGPRFGNTIKSFSGNSGI